MINRIFYIGGASGSGKSQATDELVKKYNLKNIELDKYHNIITNYISKPDADNLTNDVVKQFVTDILTLDCDCILDGGWINPGLAFELKSKYGKRFIPCYVGYPKADAKSRLKMLKERGSHPLSKKPENEAICEIKNQISGSACYQSECQKFKIEFIDFTVPQSGQEELVSYFEAECL